ncbi:SpoIIE family protein phosphatase [bacterium]|nr:SpoIIE family protein phosphatase [bacterium]
MLDLREWDFTKNTTVNLDGEWEFYWQTFLDPKTIHHQTIHSDNYITFPRSWKGYDLNGEQLSDNGYATFRLKILLSEHEQTFGIKTRTLNTAHALYINGKRISTAGKVGTTAQTSIPIYITRLDEIQPSNHTLDIILHVSNFHCAVGGGTVFPIEFGLIKNLREKRIRNLVVSFFICGSLFIMGLFYMSLNFIRKKELYFLYFGIFCLIITAIPLTLGENYLFSLFGGFHPSVFWTLMSVIIAAGASSSSLFLKHLFPKEFSDLVLKVILITSIIYILVCLLLPIRQHTQFWNIFRYQFLCCLYYIYVLILATKRKRESAPLLLIGFFFVLLTVFNDGVLASFGYSSISIAPLGYFSLLLFFGSALSIRYSKSFIKVEVLSEKLERRNRSLMELNKNIEQKVIDRTQSLKNALETVEQFNKKIIGSIEYAKRIQHSLLPNEALVQNVLPYSFIIWEPRDIVGGDLYYIDRFDCGFIISVIDCTGHGVPGALMTMLASSSLRRITVDERCLDPAEILRRLNSLVKTSLQQETEHVRSNDGMDASVCFVNTKDKKVTYAGANLPLTYICHGNAQTVNGDRQSIGYKKSDLDFEFTSHQINIEDDMVFYLYSDGITGQLGGEKRLSFGTKKLENLLRNSYKGSFDQQKLTIIESLEEYKGNNEIQDDITIVGFRVQ